jgi:hypothetical protein
MFSDSCTVEVIQAIGISSIASEQGIRVYPNPFKERIYIRAEDMGNIQSLEILNVAGQVVKRLDQHELGAGYVEVNLEVPGNIFLLRMRTDKRQYTQKIVRK